MPLKKNAGGTPALLLELYEALEKEVIAMSTISSRAGTITVAKKQTPTSTCAVAGIVIHVKPIKFLVVILSTRNDWSLFILLI